MAKKQVNKGDTVLVKLIGKVSGVGNEFFNLELQGHPIQNRYSVVIILDKDADFEIIEENENGRGIS